MADQSERDDDPVRLPVGMTRDQRRRFRVVAAKLDQRPGEYVLAAALPQLEADERRLGLSKEVRDADGQA